jgi:hypothetical protein
MILKNQSSQWFKNWLIIRPCRIMTLLSETRSLLSSSRSPTVWLSLQYSLKSTQESSSRTNKRAKRKMISTLVSKKWFTVFLLAALCLNGGIQMKMLVNTAGTTRKTSLTIRAYRTLSWKKELHKCRKCLPCDPSEFNFRLNLGLSVKM